MRSISRSLLLILLVPVMALAVPLALARYLWAVLTAPARAIRIAISFDQLANVALNGDEDETISSRADRAREQGKRWGCVLCKLLDRIDTNHCRKSRGV
jgi:hypothetical protein